MKRSGFALVLAIGVVVLISIVGVVIMSIATDSTKRMNDDFLKLQAQMLAKSAREYALLRISGFDRSGGECLEFVDIVAEPYFEINATIWYIFDGSGPANCRHVLWEESFGSDANDTAALIDVVVSSKADATESSEPIVIHQRTLEKL